MEEEKKESNKREVNYIEEEDVCLCIAHVNISQDGAIATNQTMEDFWERIAEKFLEQQSKCTACLKAKRPVRKGSSLRNRFDRKIKPTVNEFNGFYKPCKENPVSGENEEDIIRNAHEKCLEAKGKPFGLVGLAQSPLDLALFKDFFICNTLGFPFLFFFLPPLNH